MPRSPRTGTRTRPCEAPALLVADARAELWAVQNGPGARSRSARGLLLAVLVRPTPALLLWLAHLHCREIEDKDAKKPEGWLDDEPLEVADPGGCRRRPAASAATLAAAALVVLMLPGAC